MNTDIAVIHVVAGLHPKSGGPSRTVVQLTDCLAHEPGIAVTLVSQRWSGEPTVESTVATVERIIESTSSRFSYALGLPVRNALQRLRCTPRLGIIHSHGLWLPANAWAARMARREGVPLLIHPRGMLERWALQHRGLKKRVALGLYQRRDLHAAVLFFATSEMEAESIRRLGFEQPIAVIPNGVNGAQLSSVEPAGDKSQVLRTALFLSRIHPKKGLLNLIDAWSQLQPPGWRLRIAGPDEGGHLSEVMRKVTAQGLGALVEYVGEVDGRAKVELFATADLFVLPSFSENFGVVIAEALACGIPVITTRGTPWEKLMHHGCGWWVDPTVDALAVALREAMSIDPAILRAMGAKGREYAREFDWSSIARQTADVYRWVSGQGPIPECVITE